MKALFAIILVVVAIALFGWLSGQQSPHVTTADEVNDAVSTAQAVTDNWNNQHYDPLNDMLTVAADNPTLDMRDEADVRQYHEAMNALQREHCAEGDRVACSLTPVSP